MAVDPPDDPSDQHPDLTDPYVDQDVDPGPPTGPGADLLSRAGRAARDDDRPEGWVEVEQTVMTRVRTLVTPAHPLLTFTAGGGTERDDRGSRTWVSSRVVVAALRRALQQPTHVPRDIDLDIDDERLTGIEVSLVCAYGPDLRDLAERVRHEVLAELVTLLGPDPALDVDRIGIAVVDVVLGDPTRV